MLVKHRSLLGRLFLVPAQYCVGSIFDAAQRRLAPRLRAAIPFLVVDWYFEWTLRIFRLRIWHRLPRQHDIVQAARMFPELPDLIPVGGVVGLTTSLKGCRVRQDSAAKHPATWEQQLHISPSWLETERNTPAAWRAARIDHS